MSPFHYFYHSVTILLLSLLSATAIETQDITVTLKPPLTNDTKNVYTNFIQVNRSSTIRVNVNNTVDYLSFIVFQVHSHLHLITIYRNNYETNTYEYGTNIGLYSKLADNDIFYIQNGNEDVDLNVYLAIQGYTKEDPIPGGCNMESHVPVSPGITIQNFLNFVYVDVPPPQSPKEPQCLNPAATSVTVYLMYMPQQNFDSNVYFESIQTMMQLKTIEENGHVVPAQIPEMLMRHIVAIYPGTGVVFVAVAHVVNKYSIYVPAQTYGCSPLTSGDCELMKDMLSMLLCALCLFIGLFLCYFRQRFFKTELFIFGFMSGFILTYMGVSLLTVTDATDIVLASALSGVFFAGLWILFWWLYGIPIFTLLLTSLNVGFLLASLLFYVLPDDEFLFEGVSYWAIFTIVVLLTAIVLIASNYVAYILACSIIGGYTTIYPIDMYIGSNMKYILINTLRRATVKNYDKVFVVPTFQNKDLLLTILWVSLTLSSFVFQYYINRGRPPFPPPPRGIRARPSFMSPNSGAPNERTPLLS